MRLLRLAQVRPWTLILCVSVRGLALEIEILLADLRLGPNRPARQVTPTELELKERYSSPPANWRRLVAALRLALFAETASRLGQATVHGVATQPVRLMPPKLVRKLRMPRPAAQMWPRDEAVLLIMEQRSQPVLLWRPQ